MKKISFENQELLRKVTFIKTAMIVFYEKNKTVVHAIVYKNT
jgi:hypothetical protein